MRPSSSVFATLVAFILLSAPASFSIAMTASQLTVSEGFASPAIGLHDATPTFSWKLPAGVERQSAYRLEARVGADAWDSGWIESDQSTFVPYAGRALRSRERVAWRVNVRDGTGRELGWSGPATFELGLLSNADWKAKWIRPATPGDPESEPVANLRRSFTIDRPIARARLYVTARGLFAMTINGRRVGDDHFANGFTAYDQRLDTLTYDVTQSLKQGDNAIDGLLACGWYAGRFPFAAKTRGPYGREPMLLAQLEIAYADGTSETIATDEQWQAALDGPIVSSSVYDGEAYDARRAPADWKPVIAEADLGPARLVPKPAPPVRAVTTLATRAITTPEPGRFIFDLGQNMVGWARVKIPVEAGRTVTIRFAEMLKADGTLYTENYRTARSIDTYAAAESGAIEWEPRFTFHGFRYVELTGLPAGATPDASWVTGVVLHSDLPVVGTFDSSHAKLNQLQRNIVWGWRGNSLDVPTDCPQRDERLGWTGDAQAFCATAMFNTDAHAFWSSWLGSMRDEQDADGLIPDTIPTAKVRWRNRSPGWVDAATFVPWDVYVRTGDARVLADNFEMMARLVGWYRAQAKDGRLPGIKGFGDWLQPHPQIQPVKGDWMGVKVGDTPRPLLGEAFYARSARILADAARVLGRADDARRYGSEADAVRDAFARRYFDADGKLQNAPETQTAYALALAFDLVPADRKSQAAANLVRLVDAADGHLCTGFLGTPYLVRVLDESGHSDVAFRVLLKDTYPSWFYSIDQGATTIWERWNSYSHEHGFGDVEMNSFNHYAYGAIGQWMYERLAGLAPDAANPGYKHFFVRPLTTGPITSARAELETPYGRAMSAWERKGDRVTMEVTVPPNATATITFPDGRADRTVAAGMHRFECALAAR